MPTVLSCPTPALSLVKDPTFWIITGAALLDSVNPCAIAVLLILLTGLLITPNKVTVLKLGIAFITGLYLAYYSIGLGALKTLELTGFAPILHKAVGIIAIIIGIISLRDAIWYKKEQCWLCEAKDPKTLRGRLQKMLGSIATPIGAFALGLLVTLVELPCTGGPYLFILGLLANGTSLLRAGLILLYYNLIFVLPLIIILYLTYWGVTTVEKTTLWRDKNMRLINWVTGIVMIALGIWLCFN
ncbi:sulfite exporter TauE/SafE family protein [Patescibacteria group bacterium]|nr:sulfite exporter TauE/SafE family protein [Patescibacteria group bacterium]